MPQMQFNHHRYINCTIDHKVTNKMTGHPELESIEIECDTGCDAETQSCEKSFFQKRIRRVLNRQENKICLDCSRPGPRWASIISIPPPTDSPINDCLEDYSFGGFCCLECSGAHRTLGTHVSFVRSIDFDSLKERELQALEMTGNAVVNSIYEGRLFSTAVGGRGIAISFTKEIKPDASSDQNTRELFIKNKYNKKMYLDILALNRFHQTLVSSLDSPVRETVIISPNSSNETQTSLPKLQIFTSSPRTLAMLEKYMNPKPKKKKLSNRIRAALGLKKNSAEDCVPTSHVSDAIVNMPASLKIHQKRSTDESVDELGPFSDSECNLDFDTRKNKRNIDRDEDCSVTSTQSAMTAKRRRWISKSKKLRRRKKSKRLRRSKSQKLIPVIGTNDDSYWFDGKHISCKEELTRQDPSINRHSALSKQSTLACVKENSSRDSTSQIGDDQEENNREEEISLMTIWSRGIERVIFRRFKTNTSKRQDGQLSSPA